MKETDIVQALRCCAEGECKDCAMHEDKQRCQENLLDKAAEAIERLTAENAALREKQRWIPVTERMPEIGQKCLIANREIVVRGWLRPDGVWKTGVSSDELWSKFSLHTPTHWMPLPEPPKEETP